MPDPILHPDKYGLILSGPFSARPAANAVGARAVWICTDEDNLGVVYIKPNPDSDWIRVTLIGAAPSPHGNAHHYPYFAEVGHTHPLSDITGTIAIGWIRVGFPKDFDAPTGDFWEERLPPLSITGTVVQIYRLILYIPQAPSGTLVYTVKIGNTTLCQLSVGAGQNLADTTLGSPYPVSGGEILRISGPTGTAGAKGFDLKVLLRRLKA